MLQELETPPLINNIQQVPPLSTKPSLISLRNTNVDPPLISNRLSLNTNKPKESPLNEPLLSTEKKSRTRNLKLKHSPPLSMLPSKNSIACRVDYIRNRMKREQPRQERAPMSSKMMIWEETRELSSMKKSLLC